MPTLRQHYATLLQLLRLPVARLQFHAQIDPDAMRAAYRYFTKPHPRYKLIRNKTLGAALLDLSVFDTRDKYLAHIRGKNCGAHHAQRARARGYRFAEIERNTYIDDIYAINTSLEQRQGRPMDAQYLVKVTHFERERHYRYYGILNPDGKLMAYANVGLFGNFAAFSQLIGLRNNDGIMHLLIVEVVNEMIAQPRIRYLMYDTMFGAPPGMQLFKNILGFRPFRAKYSLV
jgi:hypothetical protein